ncbi:MAG: carboxypeptidase regulatory-like domain-containing protein [Acidobacteria bacterium]|nr:carboxypeptidase regulatory-like domain-containing protein [Acidobacteriota bacterium]
MTIKRVCFAILLISSIAFAQVATSRLDGTVQDGSGAVIPGAKVVALNEKTQARAEATANSEGSFIFPSLQPGIYTVTAEAKGFRKAVMSGLELNVSVTVTQRFTMEVGQVTESVVVEADAARVQTSDSQVGRSVTLRDIDTLPQLARSPVALAVFQPGTQIDPSDTTFTRINGMRQGSNNTTLDGISANDSVTARLGLSLTANNTDSVGEFRVITNGAKAEYGHNAGGQVELITRSGTNEWHGNLFDYHRNTVLNANNFFNNSSGVKRPKYIQNLFGGSVGGAAIKNKTFFFFNYQGSRVAQEVVRNRTVLSPEAKKGIFRWRAPGSTAISSFDIAANDPRRIGVDKEVAKIFSVLPDPNNSDLGDGLNTLGFRFNNPAGSWNNSYTGRADHNLKEGLRLFFRYSWFKTYSIDALNSADATFPGMPQGWQGGIRSGYSIGSDWVISPSLVNEARVGTQAASVEFARPARQPNWMLQANLYTNPYLPNFPQGRNSPTWDIIDNLTKLWGKHTFKMGGALRFINQWGYNDAGIYPNVTVGTSLGAAVPAGIGPTVASGTINAAGRQTFESLYNDVLGRMNQVTQTFYSDLKTWQPAGSTRLRDFLLREHGFFFQDDWKLNRRLTLNLGLRWEFNQVPNERNGYQGSLDKAASMNTVSQFSDVSITKDNAWYNQDWNNFAPRFGFAFDPKGDGKTAIRGSYGMFYDRLIGATVSSADSGTPGFSQSVLVYPNQAAGSDVRLAGGVPATQPPAAPQLTLPATRSTSVTIFNPNLRTPYVHQFSLNVQREVARNTVVEVGYVGSRGVKLFMNTDLNQQRVYGEFLQSFKELQAYQTNSSSPISPGNTMVRIFGTPSAAISSLGAANFTQGLVGTVATNLDRTNYSRYTAAGVSPYYLRNYPQFISVQMGANHGRSYYNSMQLSLRRNMRDLQVFANYTFSKSIDNSSVEGNGAATYFDSYNHILFRGRSDWDRPHSFNMSATYIIPFGRGKKFGSDMPQWLDSAVGGWELGGLMIWQSGSVYTVSSSRATTHGGVNTWANYTGDRKIGSVVRKGDGVWFLTSDEAARFTFPAAGDVGTSGRNSFRGPRYFNTDMSIVKRFKIYERHTVTFRAEGYNMWNNPNFANPSVSLTTPASFGKISGMTGGARIFQLALRYDF